MQVPPGNRSSPKQAERLAAVHESICAAITNTMGGIVVDRNGAVLDRNDTPLPGLFAAGSTVGGLDGGPNAGYVGGLIKATIALRAAEAIAAA